MSNAVASQISDKCYPCPLVNGEYSTHTGMLLRNTYQPMLNLLREQLAECSESIKGKLNRLIKPKNDKTNKMTCAPCEDSDQPWHHPSLIKALAVHSRSS